MSCLVKRSQALRGRNLTRDSQADGAPTALLGPAPHKGSRGLLLLPPVGHRSPCLKKSRGLGQSPRDCLPIHGLCAEPSTIVIRSPSESESTHITQDAADEQENDTNQAHFTASESPDHLSETIALAWSPSNRKS